MRRRSNQSYQFGARDTMSGTAQETQWFIARDGEQHGPLSEAEMRTFIELRHLRSTDLVWRAGFVDWRPAPLIFPMQAHGEVEDPSPPPARQISADPPIDGKHAVSSPVLSALEGDYSGGDVPSEPPVTAAIIADQSARPRSGMVRVAAGGLLAVVVALGGWFTASSLGFFDWGPSGTAPLTADAARFSTAAGPGAPSLIDTRFQAMPLWNVVKKEFPDWYGERLAGANKLSADKQSDAIIMKHFVEGLVDLRRKHAEEALAASTPRLRGIASAFLENLKSLSAQSTAACYSFISQGETSPVVIDLLQKPEDSELIQGQGIAIMQAIAEGRRAPVAHEKPNKADYDVLAGGLMQLGWSQADLQLFADPRALARSTPDRVCKMVQDWFVAHISIKDEGTQARLLVETLRPVVAG